MIKTDGAGWEPRFRPSVARVEVIRADGQIGHGTGVLITETIVLTAFHVVGDRSADQPTFYDERGGHVHLVFPSCARSGRVVRQRGGSPPWSRELDFALVESVSPPENVCPIALGDVIESGREIAWCTFGFPEAAAIVEDGMVFDGHVANAAGRYQGASAIQLYSDQAAAAEGAPVPGLSGAPVLVRGLLVGILRSSLVADGGLNVAGTLFACPIREIASHCPDILPHPSAAASRHRTPAATRTYHHIATMPNSDFFVGRAEEQRTLRLWTESPSCRCIVVTGSAGMGKSLLAAHHVRAVEQDWPFIIWESVRDAPKSVAILNEIWQSLSKGKAPSINPEDTHPAHEGILQLLKKRRALVILDNLESLLDLTTGDWLPEQKETGLLVKAIAAGSHQSVLLMTTQQMPADLKEFAGEDLPLRHLPLRAGLNVADGKCLMEKVSHELHAENPDTWERAVNHYRGNPYALKLVARAVQDFMNADLDELGRRLGEFGFSLSDFDAFLARQFDRVVSHDPHFQEVLFCLALGREPVSEEALRRRVPLERSQFERILSSLRFLQLVEETDTGVGLAPQMMDFLTRTLLQRLRAELNGGALQVLRSQTLLWTDIKEYQRAAQRQALLRPLLRLAYGDDSAEPALLALISDLKANGVLGASRAAGNLVNLLIEDARRRTDCCVHLERLDWSNLTLSEVDFEDVTVQQSNLSNANLKQCILPEVVGAVITVCAGPESIVLAGDSVGQIHVWDTRSLRRHTMYSVKDAGWVWALAVSPDCQHVASGHEDCNVRIWTLSSGDCRTLEGSDLGHRGAVRAVTFLGNGDCLASSGSDGRILLWSTHDRSRPRELPAGHEGPVWSLAAVVRNGREQLVTGGEDCTVRLLDLQSETEIILGRHEKRVHSVAVSNDGLLAASGGQDGVVKLWSLLAPAPEHAHVKTLRGHDDWIWSIAFSKDGIWLASGGEDQKVCVWRVASGKCEKTLVGHVHAIRGVCFADANKIVSGGYDQAVRLWHSGVDGSRTAALKTWQGRVNQLRTVSFSPDGRMFACAGSDGAIRVHFAQNPGREPAVLVGHRSLVWSVAFDPDGQEIASVSDDATLRVWDVPAGDEASPHRQKAAFSVGVRVRALSIDHGGNWMACGCNDHRIRLFKRSRAKEWTPHDVLEGHRNWIWAVAFDPTGRFLASSSEDGTVALWDIKERTRVGQVATFGRIHSICFDPSGRVLAGAGSDGMLRLWLVDMLGTLSCRQVIPGHPNWVWILRFDPAGRWLASAGADCCIRLWRRNEEGGVDPAVVQVVSPEDNGHRSWVRTLAFGPNGQWLASGGDDEVVKLWRVGPDKLIFDRDVPVPRAWGDTTLAGVRGLNDSEKMTLATLGAHV